jgi:hypothetical protein
MPALRYYLWATSLSLVEGIPFLPFSMSLLRLLRERFGLLLYGLLLL